MCVRTALYCALAGWLLAGTAGAQLPRLVGPTGPLALRTGVVLAVDDDDDDEDGRLDLEQAEAVPTDDLFPVRMEGPVTSPLVISVTGGVRLIAQGRPVAGDRLVLAPADLPRELWLQGTRASSEGVPAVLRIETGPDTAELPVHVFSLTVLDATNQPIDPRRASLSVSLRVTNDRSLPRGRAPELISSDPDNFRVELRDSRITRNRVEVTLQSVDPATGRVRDEQPLLLTRFGPREPHRSRFVRLVADPVDEGAAGVADQLLRVAVRDRVRVRRGAEVGARGHHDLRVGRPGDDGSEQAAMRVQARVVVLRVSPGGPPVIGNDDLSARGLVRAQLAVSNQIWAQCQMTFGPPSEASIEIADPPPAALLAVADGDGLPAAGEGAMTFLVNDTPIGPVATVRGARPVDTALRLRAALEAAGFFARLTTNPRTSFGADSSADLLVTTRDGALARIDPAPGKQLTTDSRQSLRIGWVDLSDGLDEFDNMTARSGTLEERTLLKSVMDDDPRSIDVIIVNRFARGSRQGEAFIEASEGSIANAVLLDRNGLSQVESAWTMAHEVGHVLLDEPLHPDNVGPDRPWLLMDSDSSRGTVLGPKRLTREECLRVRRLSGPETEPALLSPYDPRGSPARRDAAANAKH
jgi:hypothetical protein